jgi:RNA polymerase sigma-54 factor
VKRLSFALEMTMAPRLGLEVSPALVTFGEMLMLPYAAMQAVIEDEVGANPALERVDAGECPICRNGWRARCPVCAAPASGLGASVQPRSMGADVAVAESDSEALLHAVRMETTAADAAIAEYVVASLDRHGLLDRSCAQLAAELRVAESRVAGVLSVVRRAGPPGVGATTVTESLLLQLDAYCPDDHRTPLARAVIADHLPALAKGHFASIAAALGTTRAEVRDVLALIRQRLRPYPAFEGTATEPAVYVVPDVVVREHDDVAGELTVELVEPALTRLAIRPRGMRGDGPSVAQARSFVAQLRDRWQTLWRIADCAVQRQKAFLVHGPAALVPLTRAEVAADLGLHESTVSRAVADKYALLPDRTMVALSRFFGGSGVDEELRKLLESADGPMCDRRLADLLRDAGYPIARRTVAKRRARLGITAASLR